MTVVAACQLALSAGELAANRAAGPAGLPGPPGHRNQ
jgi:hypothetical protein